MLTASVDVPLTGGGRPVEREDPGLVVGGGDVAGLGAPRAPGAGAARGYGLDAVTSAGHQHHGQAGLSAVGSGWLAGQSVAERETTPGASPTGAEDRGSTSVRVLRS